MANRVPQPDGDQLVRFAGRKFSQFSVRHNVYCVPIDEQEQQRLDELDRILREFFNGRTVFPPFPPRNNDDSDSSPAVLDCGFGKGAWIERLLDEFGSEELDVTGVDIFLGSVDSDEDDDDENGEDDVEEVQEFVKKRWNLNARFRDDRGNDRLRPETFDLINSRSLAEGINADRWPSFVRELKQMLKPGGWLQMVELELHVQSSSGRLRDDSYLTRWWQWYSDALQRMNKNVRVGRDLQRLLAAEGFEHIRALNLDLPIGNWHQEYSSLGRDNLRTMDQMLTSLSLWPLLRISGMDQDMYTNLIRGARSELRADGLKLYYKVYVFVTESSVGLR